MPKETTCSVCFNSLQQKKMVKLTCDCISCPRCISSWVGVKVMEPHYSVGDAIPCINYDCKKQFLIQNITSQLPAYLLGVINDFLLQVHIKNSKDIRRCPNSTCQNAGVIETSRSCSSHLICSVCGTRWREKTHFSKIEKMKKFLLHQSERKNELLCTIWEKRKTKQCPSCHIKIEKNGGCEHMTCAKCKHEFCWVCLGKFPNHHKNVHNYQRKKSIFINILLLILLILSYQISYVRIVADWTVVPVFWRFIDAILWVVWCWKVIIISLVSFWKVAIIASLLEHPLRKRITSRIVEILLVVTFMAGIWKITCYLETCLGLFIIHPYEMIGIVVCYLSFVYDRKRLNTRRRNQARSAS